MGGLGALDHAGDLPGEEAALLRIARLHRAAQAAQRVRRARIKHGAIAV